MTGPKELVTGPGGRKMPYGELIYGAAAEQLTEEWQSTQAIAANLGLEWRPGSADLAPLRRALYALQLAGHAEQEVRQNGHLWRRKAAA